MNESKDSIQEREESLRQEKAEIADAAKKQPITDPAEQLRKLCRGKLKLLYPFRAHGQDVGELSYDFCDLTGAEMMDALDSVAWNSNPFEINNRQALALFATTCEKCAPMVEEDGMKSRLYDAKDVRRGLKAADTVKGVQLAKLFYNASSQAGNRNISNE